MFKVNLLILSMVLAISPVVYAQQQGNASTSSASSSASAAGSSAAGAAVGGVTVGVVSAAVAAIAVAAAISSSKADPVYTYSNTGQAWGTVTICIANC